MNEDIYIVIPNWAIYVIVLIMVLGIVKSCLKIHMYRLKEKILLLQKELENKKHQLENK